MHFNNFHRVSKRSAIGRERRAMRESISSSLELHYDYSRREKLISVESIVYVELQRDEYYAVRNVIIEEN